VCSLLGTPESEVVAALTTKSLRIRGETSRSLLTVKESRNARDSLAKAIYAKLFSAVVSRINESITVTKAAAEPAAGRRRWRSPCPCGRAW
jgi:myosin heavy subunit